MIRRRESEKNPAEQLGGGRQIAHLRDECLGVVDSAAKIGHPIFAVGCRRRGLRKYPPHHLDLAATLYAARAAVVGFQKNDGFDGCGPDSPGPTQFQRVDCKELPGAPAIDKGCSINNAAELGQQMERNLSQVKWTRKGDGLPMPEKHQFVTDHLDPLQQQMNSCGGLAG